MFYFGAQLHGLTNYSSTGVNIASSNICRGHLSALHTVLASRGRASAVRVASLVVPQPPADGQRERVEQRRVLLGADAGGPVVSELEDRGEEARVVEPWI